MFSFSFASLSGSLKSYQSQKGFLGGNKNTARPQDRCRGVSDRHRLAPRLGGLAGSMVGGSGVSG